MVKELGEEEVERLRGVEKEERRKRVEARRKREEEANERWREEVEKRKERKRKEQEEKEERKEQKEQERKRKRRKMDEEQGEPEVEVVELGAVPKKVEAPSPQVSLIEKSREESLLMFIKCLAEYFEGVKTRIVEYESMREEGNQNKTYLNDFMKDVGERVDGSIRKAFGNLKLHMRWYKAVDGRLWKAAVMGVVDVLEYVYLPVELKVVTESGE